MFSDSYGCVCPNKLSNIIKKRNRHCLNSDYKIKSLTKKEIVFVQVVVYL